MKKVDPPPSFKMTIKSKKKMERALRCIEKDIKKQNFCWDPLPSKKS